MPEEKKAESTAAATKGEPMVRMQHEVFRHAYKMAIGEEWFEVSDDGTASFPLRLLDAAELAGFRRVS